MILVEGNNFVLLLFKTERNEQNRSINYHAL